MARRAQDKQTKLFNMMQLRRLQVWRRRGLGEKDLPRIALMDVLTLPRKLLKPHLTDVLKVHEVYLCLASRTVSASEEKEEEKAIVLTAEPEQTREVMAVEDSATQEEEDANADSTVSVECARAVHKLKLKFKHKLEPQSRAGRV